MRDKLGSGLELVWDCTILTLNGLSSWGWGNRLWLALMAAIMLLLHSRLEVEVRATWKVFFI